MPTQTLRQFVNKLHNSSELQRITTFVDPILEAAEINDRIVKNNGKALLFENNGTQFPLLMNLYGSESRMCQALNVSSLDDISKEIERMFKTFTQPRQSFLDKLQLLPELAKMGAWMPVTRSGKGACQDVVMTDPDLNNLPILQCWPYDGGRFITLPLVHTISLNTGIRNMGMYRMQVFDGKTTGMHWHLHKTGAMHMEEYRKAGKHMPVTVVLGGDPVYTYCATAPLPENVDEYILAGFLRKQKVELVKCLTNDLYVPSDADFVIEGYVDPSEEKVIEGPFGDHTGYYSLPDLYPQFHVTCITHCKDAIYPATIVGTPPQEDQWLGKATERIFLAPIRLSMLPEVVDMNLPAEGGFHNISLVSANIHYPGHANKIMNSLWGAGQMMFNKLMVIVDSNVNVQQPLEVLKALCDNVDIDSDLIFTSGPSDVLDHASSKFAHGGKLGIDATSKTNVISITFNTEDIQRIKAQLPQYVVNTELLSQGYPVIAVSGDNKVNFFALCKELSDSGNILPKYILYFDNDVDVFSLTDVVWRFSNNIDPLTDVTLVKAKSSSYLLIDATAKRQEDHFTREWPNIVTSDKATIAKVDAKWAEYGLGEMLESPSLKYLRRGIVESAWVNKL